MVVVEVRTLGAGNGKFVPGGGREVKMTFGPAESGRDGGWVPSW